MLAALLVNPPLVQLIEAVAMLVSHPSREVIKAALAFVKVAVVVLHREQLQV